MTHPAERKTFYEVSNLHTGIGKIAKSELGGELGLGQGVVRVWLGLATGYLLPNSKAGP